jgi:hypothetical protein
MALMTDGPGFDAAAADADFVVLSISRQEVEAGNVSDALDRLLNLSDNATHVRNFEDRLAITIAGYDADPRELHQIPEVVTFFRRLSGYWPYWLHFAEKHGNTIGLVFWLLCDVEVVVSGAGGVGFNFKSPDALRSAMLSLFAAQNALYEAHGLGEAANKVMTAKVMAAFERSMVS